MARVSKKSWVGPYWILSLILLQLASWAYALEGPENMDLKALLVQAAQLQNRLDQDPSDYEALRCLGTVYHSFFRISRCCPLRSRWA